MQLHPHPPSSWVAHGHHHPPSSWFVHNRLEKIPLICTAAAAAHDRHRGPVQYASYLHLNSDFCCCCCCCCVWRRGGEQADHACLREPRRQKKQNHRGTINNNTHHFDSINIQVNQSFNVFLKLLLQSGCMKRLKEPQTWKLYDHFLKIYCLCLWNCDVCQWNFEGCCMLQSGCMKKLKQSQTWKLLNEKIVVRSRLLHSKIGEKYKHGTNQHLTKY